MKNPNKNYLSSFTTLVEQEAQNWLIWSPIPIAIGTGIFFHSAWKLSGALLIYLNIFLLTVTFLISHLYKNNGIHYAKHSWLQDNSSKNGGCWIVPLTIIAFAFLCALGYSAAQLRTARLNHPILQERLENIKVRGQVDQVEFTEKGMRVYLKKIDLWQNHAFKKNNNRLKLENNSYYNSYCDKFSANSNPEPNRAASSPSYAWIFNKYSNIYYLNYAPQKKISLTYGHKLSRYIYIRNRQNNTNLYLINLSNHLAEIRLAAGPMPQSYVQMIANNDPKDIENFIPADINYLRLTSRYKLNNIKIGDWLEVPATLLPLPLPSYPNGFDFARFAYFKGLAALGYTTGRYKQLQGDYSDALLAQCKNYINQLRQTIALRIKNAIPLASASIANALLIGETKEIPLDDFNAIRIAGVAHLLAISGLHVAVVATLIFALTYAISSHFSSITLRFNIRKIAACITIFFSFCYLLLAGSPISAQRAFIASSLALSALILDRQYNSWHSLSLAAIIIILISPESLLSPSLQMSFSACLSLIAVFKDIRINFSFIDADKYPKISKTMHIFSSSILSSIASSIATAPFIIYHFNQSSWYSVIANLLCIPLNNFGIMPLGIASLILMPLGLEKMALLPMSWLINLLTTIAKSIADMPYSNSYVVNISNLSMTIISLSLVIFCITTITKLRYVMAIIFASTLFFGIAQHRYPDLIVSGGGQIFAINTDILRSYQDNSRLASYKSKNSHVKYIFSSKHKEKFTQNVWSQSLDSRKFALPSLNYFNIKNCKADLCQISLGEEISSGPNISIEEPNTYKPKRSGYKQKNEITALNGNAKYAQAPNIATKKALKIVILNKKQLLNEDFAQLCSSLKVYSQQKIDKTQFMSLFINMQDPRPCQYSSLNITQNELRKIGTYTLNMQDFLTHEDINTIKIEKTSDYTNLSRPWYTRSNPP